MKQITLNIDGQSVTADEGTTLLKAAKSAGINIPTLCCHDELEPAGVCRLCMVEIKKGNRSRTVASCVYPVEEGIEVLTETDKINKIRRMLIELLMPVAPSGPINALAKKYGIEKSRFTLVDEEPSHCSLCGICVRYCEQVTGEHAVGFFGRGVNRKVALLPEKGHDCVFCRKCFEMCNSGRFIEIAEAFPEQV